MAVSNSRLENLTPQQRATVAIKALQARLEQVERAQSEPIAIIGMSCRVPGADNPAEFWKLLRDGVDAITEVPADRWDIDAFWDADPERPGKSYTRCGGFIRDVDRFDADFFGIAHREAISMDPQQRLLLELTWEAIENAGYAVDRLGKGATGVFIGMSVGDYWQLASPQLGAEQIDAYSGMGGIAGIGVGRLSYLLNLQGPNFPIDTTCSSSLVAVHLACESLRRGESQLAIAGGVSLNLSPAGSIFFSKLRALAPDGRCKTFDAAADGFSRSEGAGIVVLKRLCDAQRDRDHILAVVRGTAVNHDGRSGGLTTPNGQAQEAVLRAALAAARLEGSDVAFVETHGTGTALGDPIEVEALAKVYGAGRDIERPLLLSAVKTNLGHLQCAAGVASLMKVVLALQHGEIPPHLHYHTPSPFIPWKNLPVRVARERMAWPVGPRVAGVSAFGMSGTNAHVLVEAAPAIHGVTTALERPQHVLCLSARTPAALASLAAQYGDRMRAEPALAVGDLCFTAAAGRTHFAQRIAVIGSSTPEIAERLTRTMSTSDSVPGVLLGTRRAAKPKIAFLFSGQGTQFAGMGKELYATQSTFRQTIDEAQEILRPYLDVPLIEVLHPPAGQQSMLDHTRYTQPALFALEYALAQLWINWGIEPALVMGHSLGEYVAATVAGLWDWRDGLRLVAGRAQTMQQLPPGGTMAAVMVGDDVLRPYLAGADRELSIAAVNGPRMTTLAGTADAITRVLAQLDRQGISSQRLAVSHAFHSPLVEPALDELQRLAEATVRRPLRRGLVSNVTGQLIRTLDLGGEHWRRHSRQPVLFQTGIKTLHEHGVNLLIEIGPGTTLLSLGRQCVGDEAIQWLPSLTRHKPEWEQLLDSLARLYTQGAAVDWAGFDADYPRRRLPLPTYPFERERFWLDMAPRTTAKEVPAVKTNVVAAKWQPQSVDLALEERAFVSKLNTKSLPFLADHRVEGEAILPAAGFISLMLATLPDTVHHGLTNVVFLEPLTIPDDATVTVQIVHSHDPNGGIALKLHSSASSAADGEPKWNLHATARAADDRAAPTNGAAAHGQSHSHSATEAKDRCSDTLEGSAFYAAIAQTDLELKGVHQGLVEVRRGDREAIGRVRLATELHALRREYAIHPSLLDACVHVMLAAGANRAAVEEAPLYLPFSVERVRLLRSYEQVPAELWCHATLRPMQADGQTLAADLRIYDLSGELVGELEGLHARRLRQAPTDWRQWLYEVEWKPQDLLAAPTVSWRPDAWLVIGEPSVLSEALLAQLAAPETDVTFVAPGTEFEADLAGQLQAKREKRLGIVELADRCPAEDVVGAQRKTLGRSLTLVQLLLRARRGLPTRLWLVTRGAHQVDTHSATVDPWHAALAGLGRVMVNEHPELRPRLLDIDPDSPPQAAAMLLAELSSASDEDQVAHRGSQRYVPRLQRLGVVPESPYGIMSAARGSLDRIELRPRSRAVPGPGEVEIEVRAAGLNFIDVLDALGGLSFEREWLGAEASGIVSAVGEGVTEFAPGDEILGVVPGAFGSHAITRAALLARKPERLSFAEAAALPVAYLTAWTVFEQARLQAGERVLIHAAAGGVGQAAVYLAQALGAEIHATAGSDAKRDFLRGQGVEHLYASRSLDFAEEIHAATAGGGINLILNSLTGDSVGASLTILAERGRFVEIGKIGVWDAERVRSVRPDVDYRVYDLSRELLDESVAVGQRLRRLVERVASGELPALPIKEFSIADAARAFRYMSEARQIGKIVLTVPIGGKTDEPVVAADGSYLITGGFGGLGLLMAQWLFERGAKRLMLMGHHQPSTMADETIRRLRTAGAIVATRIADVADREQLAQALAACREERPLRGVFHCAGSLDDGLLENQSWQRFRKVTAPKIDAAWHLHELTLADPVDHFVLFSSASALLGSTAQGNHAAASAFLDGLGHYRRQRGLPANSINWGAWRSIGRAADRTTLAQLRRQGLGSIAPMQGLLAFTHLLAQPGAQYAAVPIDWQRIAAQVDRGGVPSLLRELLSPSAGAKSGVGNAASGELPRLLAKVRPNARGDAVRDYVAERVVRVLGRHAASPIDRQAPLRDLGMDSLMAIELTRTLSASTGLALQPTILFDHPTIEALADHVHSQLHVEDLATADVKAPATSTPRDLREPIAIVGMACRFPGAQDVASYWKLLRDGVDAIREVPHERWNIDSYYDPDPAARGKLHTRCGGFLDRVDRFDAAFFGIAPREAVSMDPQQRLLLEVAWEALEDAGLAGASELHRRAGVFIGISTNDYGRLLADGGPMGISAYTSTGNALSVAAGRLSYCLGLQGPTLAVDTACSSSLVAVHLASQSLHSGESDVALAGGVNLMLAPETTLALSELGMLAPDGRCKTFDASADGFVRGEGCGIIVLKRLSDAETAGDRVLAVLRGGAVNHDGRSSGLTAPSGPSQQTVIRAALAAAGLQAADVQYLEAHGTGTSLGDPIEVRAAVHVLGEGRSREAPLCVGSVKTNLGHLEAAAGIAGLIKVVLALAHGEIPPHLHFQRPSPFIDWGQLSLKVPTRLLPWPDAPVRRAGISSFGFSGTNAHLILEAAPTTAPLDRAADPSHNYLLCLSARSPAALVELAHRYGDYLSTHDDASLADVAWSAHTGRAHFEHRLAIVVEDRRNAADRLSAWKSFDALPPGTWRGQKGTTRAKVAFVFPDDAAFSGDAVERLAVEQPAFRAALTACHTALDADAGAHDVAQLRAALSDNGWRFVVQTALAQLLRTWGIDADLVLGARSGEFAAACHAGVWSLSDALRVAAAHDTANRARLLDTIVPEPAKCDFVCSLTGQLLKSDQLLGPSYWHEHANSAGRLTDAVRQLAAGQFRAAIAFGAVPDWCADSWTLAGTGDLGNALLTVIGRLYATGIEVDWRQFDRAELRRKVPLPTYPFQRKRYWLTDPSSALDGDTDANESADDDSLGGKRIVTDDGTHVFEHRLRTGGFLGEHRLQGETVVSASTYAELVISALGQIAAGTGFALHDILFSRPLVVPADHARLVRVTLVEQDDRHYFEVTSSRTGDDEWIEHASGYVQPSSEVGLESTAEARLPYELEGSVTGTGTDYYATLENLQLHCGPRFRWITETRSGPLRGWARLRRSEPEDHIERYTFHPGLLDACFQTLSLALPKDLFEQGQWLLGAIDSLALCLKPQAPLTCHAVLRESAVERPREFVGDVFIYDERQQLVGAARGMRLKSVSAGDAAQVVHRDWFYQLDWQPVPWKAESEVADDLTPSAELIGPLDALADEIAAAADLPAYVKFGRQLETLATFYALEAFEQAGIRWQPGDRVADADITARLNAIPAYDRLVRRMLDMSVEEGWLKRDADGYHVELAPPHHSAPMLVQELIAQFLDFAPIVRLLERCGQALPEVLAGRRDPLTLLFAGGSLDQVEQVYQGTPVTQLGNRLVSETIGRATERRDGERPLRILEIGAGTGATTAAVLPRLRPGKTDYLYTDVSRVFLQASQQKFAAFPCVRYQMLDIERDPSQQGFALGTCDVVLAASVLHATRNLRETLRHAWSLLAPGGMLLLLESTRPQRWADLTFGLTDGWWRFADTDLRPDYPLLPASVWQRVLSEVGFEEVRTIPSSAAEPGRDVQAVIVGRRPLPTSVAPLARPWLLVSARSDIAAFATEMERRGQPIEATEPTADSLAAAFAKPDRLYEAVIYLAATRDGVESPVATANREAQRLRTVMQSLLSKAAAERPRVWVATHNAQPISDSDPSPAADQAALWGLGVGLGVEYPDVWGGLIDLDSTVAAGGQGQQLLAHIKQPDNEDEVALRRGERFARRLVPASRGQRRQRVHVHADATYLVIGGLSDLGLHVARWLVARGARHLILVSRRGLPDAEHDASAEQRDKIDAIRQLESAGAHIEVVGMDVADAPAMMKLLARTGHELPRLRGVFHLASDAEMWDPCESSDEGLSRALAAKAGGAWLLHELTRELPVEMFVLFSSTTGILGSKGLAPYSAANQFLDALAAARRRERLPAVSIAWGTWGAGSWRQLVAGFLPAGDIDLSRIGLCNMPPDAALACLDEAIARDRPVQVVADIDWRKLKPIYEARRPRPLLSALNTVVSRAASKSTRIEGDSRFRDQLRVSAPAARRGLLVDWLSREVGQVLGLPAGERLPPERSFFDCGMDSLMAVELKGRLEGAIGESLPASVVMNHATVDALSGYLAENLPPGDRMSSDEVLNAADVERQLIEERAALGEVAEQLLSLPPAQRDLRLLQLFRRLQESSPRPVSAPSRSWQNDARLDPQIALPEPARPVTDPDCILLTGATGFLGGYLLENLLAQTGAQVICLARGASDSAARDRVLRRLAECAPGREVGDRLAVLAGDLSQPNLGLDASRYEDLARRAQVVFHNGAILNLTLPYEELRGANVEACREVLRLTVSGTPKTLHYVSSMAVFLAPQSDGAGRIDERTAPALPEHFPNGYAQSKWVCERLIEQARRAVSTTIHRPGVVAGDSRTGAWKDGDWIVAMIAGFVRLGMMPDLGDKALDFTPVDFTARAIVELSRQEANLGRAYHLINPSPLRWSSMLAALNARNLTVEPVSTEVWLESVRRDVGREGLAPLLPWLEMLAVTMAQRRELPSLDCSDTLGRLDPTPADLPPGEELFEKCLTYLIETGVFEKR